MAAPAYNLKGLGEVHLAYSHARWTKPSMSSILSGYLPRCREVENPWEPSWVLMDFRGGRRIFFNTSPWMHRAKPMEGEERWYDPPRQGENVMRDIAAADFDLGVAIFSETHINYRFSERTEFDDVLNKRIGGFNEGADDYRIMELARKRQLNAIAYLDGLFEIVLDRYHGKVYCTSDHGELFGEHHLIGHDPSFPHHDRLFEVPLIVGEV